MAPSLSLILPVYNVAPFLPACLESLLAMTPGPAEVIAVDDGSTDESPKVLSAYSDRIRSMRIVRQTNAGTAAARNAGLALATGTHVAFLDPDDFVAPDYYGSLFRLAVEQRLDLAIGNATYHFEGRAPDRLVWERDDLPTEVAPGKELLRRRLRRRSMVHLSCLVVYRHAFLERHGLRYPSGLAHEDVIWLTEAMFLADRAAWSPEAGYFYRQRIREHGAGPERDAVLSHVIESSVTNARALASLADRCRPSDPELGRLLGWQLVDGGLSIFHKLERISDSTLRRATLKRLRREGVMHLLWRHATELRQRRKLAKRYVESVFC